MRYDDGTFFLVYLKQQAADTFLLRNPNGHFFFFQFVPKTYYTKVIIKMSNNKKGESSKKEEMMTRAKERDAFWFVEDLTPDFQLRMYVFFDAKENKYVF